MPQKKRNLKNNVQKYRVWKGLLQKDLADATGISVSEIRLIEKHRVTPQPKTMNQLCQFFDVNNSQMFYKED